MARLFLQKIKRHLKNWVAFLYVAYQKLHCAASRPVQDSIMCSHMERIDASVKDDECISRRFSAFFAPFYHSILLAFVAAFIKLP